MNKQILTVGFKFVVVGVASTAVNYGTFYLLLHFLDVHYIVASVTGYIVGLIAGFLLNHSWTFGAGMFDARKLGGYVLVYLLSLGLSSLFLWITVYFYGWNALLANVIAIGISTISNFCGLNYIIYKKKIV